MGVEEEDGIAKRPVRGLPLERLDAVQKEMVALDAKISPHYMSRVSPEMVDGRHILAIWVLAGANRPYSVMESVLAHKSVPKWYVRSKSSTIEAKGEVLDELRQLANKVPFDERGNPAITSDDISILLLSDYLKRVNSRMNRNIAPGDLPMVLDEMDLRTGPSEQRLIKKRRRHDVLRESPEVLPYGSSGDSEFSGRQSTKS